MKAKAMPASTWKPYSQAARSHLSAADKASLPTSAFAFPPGRAKSQ